MRHTSCALVTGVQPCARPFCFIVDLGELAGPEPLLAALARSIAAHDILRVQGFLAIEGRPARLVLQAVGPRIQAHYDRHWQAGDQIGRGSGRENVGKEGKDWVGAVSIKSKPPQKTLAM